MANMNPSRFGEINGSATDPTALFLKVFSGEVLTSFEISTQAISRVMTRTISSGKSAQFPVQGRTTAALHTPGTEILGNNVNANEKVIAIDGLTIADTFVANIDEAMNHYDVRGIYSTELGRALARAMDSNLLQVGLLAARTTTPNVADAGYPAGTKLLNAGYATTGATLASGIVSAAQTLDANNNPSEDRYAFLKPAQYYLLVQTTSLIDKDWGGDGSYSDGKINRIAGIELVKSNQVPSTNVTTGPLAYQGNFANTVCPIWQKGAVGCVKLMDLAVESKYEIRFQGTLMVAKYATGYGALRPESAIELATA
jgi:hypothetical protein